MKLTNDNKLDWLDIDKKLEKAEEKPKSVSKPKIPKERKSKTSKQPKKQPEPKSPRVSNFKSIPLSPREEPPKLPPREHKSKPKQTKQPKQPKKQPEPQLKKQRVVKPKRTPYKQPISKPEDDFPEAPPIEDMPQPPSTPKMGDTPSKSIMTSIRSRLKKPKTPVKKQQPKPRAKETPKSKSTKISRKSKTIRSNSSVKNALKKHTDLLKQKITENATSPLHLRHQLEALGYSVKKLTDEQVIREVAKLNVQFENMYNILKDQFADGEMTEEFLDHELVHTYRVSIKGLDLDDKMRTLSENIVLKDVYEENEDERKKKPDEKSTDKPDEKSATKSTNKSADENKELPIGWVEFKDADGDVYYENVFTLHTQWEKPDDYKILSKNEFRQYVERHFIITENTDARTFSQHPYRVMRQYLQEKGYPVGEMNPNAIADAYRDVLYDDYLIEVRQRHPHYDPDSKSKPSDKPSDKPADKPADKSHTEPEIKIEPEKPVKRGRGRPRKELDRKGRIDRMIDQAVKGSKGKNIFRFQINGRKNNSRKVIYVNSQSAGSKILRGLKSRRLKTKDNPEKHDDTEESKKEWEEFYKAEMKSIAEGSGYRSFMSPYGRVRVFMIEPESIERDEIKYVLQDSQDRRFFTSSRRIVRQISNGRELYDISLARANISRADAEKSALKGDDDSDDEKVKQLDDKDITTDTDFEAKEKREITDDIRKLKEDEKYQTRDPSIFPIVADYAKVNGLSTDDVMYDYIDDKFDLSQIKRSSIL